VTAAVAESEDVPAPATGRVPDHPNGFRFRRFVNWFPLGLTYATLYMGRYNFNVAKGDIGKAFHFDKGTMGIIATVGFWVYAVSVLVNGPLADRFGGRRAILFGAAGSIVMNFVIGAIFWRFGNAWPIGLIGGMSTLYGLNMYFQSFGALSVVKVNASWFHVRERGVLGGLFGSMISLGYALAMGVGGWLLAAGHGSFVLVYIVPVAAMATMFIVDFFVVRDRPSHAGHRDFDTGDEKTEHEAQSPASTATAPRAEPGFFEVTKHVFAHPVLRRLILAEFCTGFVRQGLLLYYSEYLGEVHHVGKGTGLFQIASWGITVGGIIGALTCGFLSDFFFQSRRAPVAFIFYLGQIASLVVLGFAPNATVASVMVGFSCIWIFGVHGLLSGTASMDFGGRRAAATAAGLLDGVQYVGAGLTGVGLGWLLDKFHWKVWTPSLLPFSAIGALVMLTLWNAKPKRGGAH
jgi:OPA family glycerol-3-phosphate transporter-like MFS transporter